MGKYSIAVRRGVLKLGLLALLAAALIIGAGVVSRSLARRETRLRTNEERVAYLAALGWEVTPTPLSEQLIQLPKVFPEVLEEYNALQQQQGFDLAAYAGRELQLYTYEVLNYPEEEEVRCCLYLYKYRVVGGDIHATSYTGFIAGIR